MPKYQIEANPHPQEFPRVKLRSVTKLRPRPILLSVYILLFSLLVSFTHRVNDRKRIDEKWHGMIKEAVDRFLGNVSLDVIPIVFFFVKGNLILL